MESTSYVLSFRMVFFYLVTTGWIFDISLLCENSINQSIMHACGPTATHDYLIAAFLSSFVLFIFGFLGEVRLFRVFRSIAVSFLFGEYYCIVRLTFE